MGIKTLVKFAVSAVIIWLVLRNIDENMLADTLKRVHPGWIIWVVVWFAISKILSAVRFNALLATEKITLTWQQNLRLYWLGMYYNLLLPGGISGDGYKIKLLMDAFGAPFKRLFAITLLDRLGGMIALAQLCLVLVFFIPPTHQYGWLVAFGLAISIPLSFLICRQAGVVDRGVWIGTSVLSLLVQGVQLIATLGIVWALNEPARWVEYSVLFLISSVVAMLPLTIGGTGARELTFLWGASVFGIDPEKAVAIAFLFYLISTAVAFAGIGFSFNEKIKPLS